MMAGASLHGTAAAREVAAEIERTGPITFARFMQIALHHPDVGYYARSGTGPGRHADYLTSPEITPCFARLISVQIEEMWRLLGHPDPFWLIEGGPGTGALAAGILETAERDYCALATALRVALIETSPQLRARQSAALSTWADRITWLEPADSPCPPFEAGCVLANELLDALPFHRVVRRREGMREVFVTRRGGALVDLELPCSDTLTAPISAGGGCLAVDQAAEISLDAPAWTGWAGGLLRRGYLILVDYGEPASVLYSRAHPHGTMRCYHRHTMNRAPYTRVGLQDITAHIDLTATTHAAEAAGLSLLGATRQRRFLTRLGAAQEAAAGERGSRSEQWAARAALGQILDPHGLGRLAVLIFGRDATASALRGLSPV